MSYISVCSMRGTAAYGYRYVPPKAHDINLILKLRVDIHYNNYVLKCV